MPGESRAGMTMHKAYRTELSETLVVSSKEKEAIGNGFRLHSSSDIGVDLWEILVMNMAFKHVNADPGALFEYTS